ncbi:hypothetical protein QQS21_005376 [Conoideocrella luteorostrata]|uniref:Nucleoside phosphorylase domain-containing protein n=1 Tax=Conoideocrella luteorostrata TaxID=1105319 RepID=A0AAJ0CS31_9HYPO|nr:hypothetical protein QQS21_005376 [Conoideocrella luteorostrata]
MPVVPAALANPPELSLSNDEYTVGWICSIRAEGVAARAFLDAMHSQPKHLSPHDNNSYILGQVGKHNVVIAVMPDGEYGIAAAACAATNMLSSFPNIRFGLLVGTGGGAPSLKHDIRLGDVVVSIPREGKGGVLQYDFGKTIQGKKFYETAFLNQPPRILLAAINSLRAHHEAQGHRLEDAIGNALKNTPNLQRSYSLPDRSSDRLYQSGFVHPNNDSGCAAACGDDHTKLIRRSARAQKGLLVHYGLIASANQVMKDAVVRDKLASEKEVLCFEMEAAGVMNCLPCLVVRGICDYSDSHKNKEWQGYAAMAAAAYAKDLLPQIAPQTVRQRQLTTHEVAFDRERSSEDEQCLQLFRLTDTSKDTTYESYKDQVEERVRGTCQWFLNHDHFQKWLNQDSGPLLVSADPGCGKSVLAKYLIDTFLPRSATICYFFFKDRDQNTVRQALCALLHQLFCRKPSLIRHAIEEYRKNGKALIGSPRSLWTVLGKAVQDPQAGTIILVLDALDECAELECENLVRNVKSQFSSNESHHSKLKYILTTRPYARIISNFQDLRHSFPNIRIPGEEESDIISTEVNLVIADQTDKLGLSQPVRDLLIEKFLEIRHRTYLWVHLVFDYLKKEGFKKTSRGVEATFATLPASVHQAYEQILNKPDGKDEEHNMNRRLAVRKILSIILAASRPLTVSEMNVAANVDGTVQSFKDIDLEEDEDFELRIRSWCGLFISVHHGKIYFLHQTAREFLLKELSPSSSAVLSSEPRWHKSITARQAHTVLAEVCVYYLSLLNYDHPINKGAFLDYSAEAWVAHFRDAHIPTGAAIVPFARRLYDLESKSFLTWCKIYRKSRYFPRDPNFSVLLLASYFGHFAIVECLLENGADIEAKDNTSGRTPLHLAARNGHEAVVKLLIDKGSNVHAMDDNDGTPLWTAADMGHEAIVELLLDSGADIEVRDSVYGYTPLCIAVVMTHEAIVELLLNKGADIEAKRSKHSQTPLWIASARGHRAIVQLFLRKGADIEAKDSEYSYTPLCIAALMEHEAIVELLLDKGADVEAKDSEFSFTPLYIAAAIGHEAIVKLLLDKGADIKAKDAYGQSPLWVASLSGHDAVVRLLLSKQSLETRSKDSVLGLTPLCCAAMNGHDSVVRMLLACDNTVDASTDSFGRTPLSIAVAKRHGVVVSTLLELSCVSPLSEDIFGLSPLSLSEMKGYGDIRSMLLKKVREMGFTVPATQGPIRIAKPKASSICCTFCMLDILEEQAHYRCTSCAWGDEDFIKCQDCEARDLKCWDVSHVWLKEEFSQSSN